MRSQSLQRTLSWRTPPGPTWAKATTQPRVTVRPKPPTCSSGPRHHDDPLASEWDRVGQPRPGPDSTTPGKPPCHTTDHLPNPSSRSNPDPLAGLAAGPRSCLAAFPWLPSVPPCGFSSGFPRSHLAVFARGSAGVCLRTEDRLRFRSNKVNGISRNPDVLPTFCAVVPKWGCVHPQLIPMLRGAPTPAGCRRPLVGVAALVAALRVAVGGHSSDAPTPAQRHRRRRGAGPHRRPRRALTAQARPRADAASDDSIGLRTPYFNPRSSTADRGCPRRPPSARALINPTPSSRSRRAATSCSPPRTRCRPTSRSARGRPWASGGR